MANWLICPQCGYRNRIRSYFCAQCGRILQQSEEKDTTKRPWKLPPDRAQAWSQFFREIGWFHTEVYEIYKEVGLAEQWPVIFSVYFPAGEGGFKKIYNGKKWVEKGIVNASNALVMVSDFQEPGRFFAYEELRHVHHTENTIYLEMDDGTEWQLVLDLPKPSLFWATFSLFIDPIERTEILRHERSKREMSAEFINMITQFFLEIVALQ